MIIDFLATISLNVVLAILSFASWPGSTTHSLLSVSQNIGGGLGVANYYFPVADVLALIAAGFVFDLSCTVVQLTKAGYTLIPFKAS